MLLIFSFSSISSVLLLFCCVADILGCPVEHSHHPIPSPSQPPTREESDAVLPSSHFVNLDNLADLASNASLLPPSSAELEKMSVSKLIDSRPRSMPLHVSEMWDDAFDQHADIQNLNHRVLSASEYEEALRLLRPRNRTKTSTADFHDAITRHLLRSGADQAYASDVAMFSQAYLLSLNNSNTHRKRRIEQKPERTSKSLGLNGDKRLEHDMKEVKAFTRMMSDAGIKPSDTARELEKCTRVLLTGDGRKGITRLFRKYLKFSEYSPEDIAAAKAQRSTYNNKETNRRYYLGKGKETHRMYRQKKRHTLKEKDSAKSSLVEPRHPDGHLHITNFTPMPP